MKQVKLCLTNTSRRKTVLSKTVFEWALFKLFELFQLFELYKSFELSKFRILFPYNYKKSGPHLHRCHPQALVSLSRWHCVDPTLNQRPSKSLSTSMELGKFSLRWKGSTPFSISSKSLCHRRPCSHTVKFCLNHNYFVRRLIAIIIVETNNIEIIINCGLSSFNKSFKIA